MQFSPTLTLVALIIYIIITSATFLTLNLNDMVNISRLAAT